MKKQTPKLMRLLLYSAILALALVLISRCSTYQHIRLQAKARLASPLTVQSFPFTYLKDLIVVEARLNGQSSPHQFIFDTGAFGSKVEWTLAQSLGLPTKARLGNTTAQGISRKVEMSLLDSLQLGAACFTGIAVGKLQYDEKSYSPCVAPDGLIGSNVIKLANWKIDYQQQWLTLSEEPLAPAAGLPLHRIAFKTSFLSGIPKIAVKIEGEVTEEVLLDVGYNGGLVLPQAYAQQFPEASSQVIIDQSSAGIFGSNRDTLIIKTLNVGIADFTTTIPVEFSARNKALLGNDFLEHFTLYLDYEHKCILLQPIEAVHIEKARSFIPGILNDSMWVVNRIMLGQPLRIGDTLSSIEGLRPVEVFQSHCDYFLDTNRFLAKQRLSVSTWRGENMELTN